MKIFKKIFKFIALCLLVNTGCTKSQLTADSSQNILSNQSYYLSDQAVIKVYWQDTGLGTYISQMAPSNGQIVLPKSMLSGDYGDRSDANTPYPLNLIAKVYYPNHPSGDFYFEAPILGPFADVTNVTTALSWFLKFSSNKVPLVMSKASFDKIVLNIEVKCDSCRKKTNTDVLNLILQNKSIIQLIYDTAQSDNPGLDAAAWKWNDPQPIWAWGDPNLSIHGIGAKNYNEAQNVIMNVQYVDPLNSTIPILPTNWSHQFNGATTHISAGILSYTFTYDESGSHTFSPVFDNKKITDTITYNLSVADVNRPPVCKSPLTISMRSNVLNAIDLSNYCQDLDTDNNSLVYALSSGPDGLTLSTTGLLQWTPSAGSSNSNAFAFTIIDSKSGVSSVEGVITIAPDQPPAFTSINASYSFTEGIEGTFTVNASDPDGDPVVMAIDPVDQVVAGLPTGSGDLSQITRTGSKGNYSYQVRFTPSFMQMIGADGSVRVKFYLHYEPGGNYDSSIHFDEHIVTFNITNADDPPQWQTQPIDIPTANEGVDFAGLVIGKAIDPNPNPTAITYSVVYMGSNYCQWTLTVNKDASGNATLSGKPGYNSEQICTFKIRATDTNGLFGDSTPFSVTTTNVNQPIHLVTSPLTVVNASEGKALSLPLAEIFDDPDLDLSPSDPRENLTYVCLVDTDNDGIYESTCDSQNINFTFANNALAGTWTPPAFSAGTYKIKLSITDVGNATATATFNLVVAASATAMNLTSLLDGIESSTISINENQTYNLTLRATAASARAIDSYNFTVSSPTCNVVGGSGSCSATLIDQTHTRSGTGTTDIIYALKPSYTDGDKALPGNSKKFNISFHAEKSDDPTVYMDYYLSVTVNNTDRAPTAIEVTKGSFGCTGSTDNADTTAFTVCVDASLDKKSGNSWSKTYTVPFVPVDADGTNDSYSFNFSDSLTPGSISGYNWNFKLPSCMLAGSTTVTRTYNLNLADGRGGTVSRSIILKILKASATASCL